MLVRSTSVASLFSLVALASQLAMAGGGGEASNVCDSYTANKILSCTSSTQTDLKLEVTRQINYPYNERGQYCLRGGEQFIQIAVRTSGYLPAGLVSLPVNALDAGQDLAFVSSGDQGLQIQQGLLSADRQTAKITALFTATWSPKFGQTTVSDFICTVQ